MAMTVNNLSTLSLLNILNKTTAAQSNVMLRMSTGSKINRGADDPAGLLAITSLKAETTAVDAGIQSNQRTDALLGVTDGALSQISGLLDEIQRLANETSNDAGLTSDEIVANQSQIDDAIASIDRIVGNTQFNGKKLLDGSLGINTTGGAGLTDIKVYSRKSGTADVSLTVTVASVASASKVASVMATSATVDSTFSVQGKLGTAVVATTAGENVSAVAAKINAAKAQTGVSAKMSSNNKDMNLYSTTKGSAAFVRTKVIEGDSTNIKTLSAIGKDASVTVNGQDTAVDGDRVSYSGQGVNMSFNLGTVTTSVAVVIKGSSAGGDSGATFQLGTGSDTQATLGIDGCYSAQLGTATDGYLRSLASGGAASLLTDPAKAATIARAAKTQVATLQGRIGGFQKFQVRTALSALNDTKEGLEKAKSVVNDVDYATESAELNRQNILLQSAMSLLGIANQQSSQVLSLLR